ncbi:MAG: YceI family protein [Flavobacteriales bacterium]|jgi:polyisoprenoid-binding protein YceI
MKKLLFASAIFAATLWACNSSTDKATDPTACDCAKEELKAENKSQEILDRCGVLRNEKMEFEKEFQACYVATKSGIEPSQVNVSKVDTNQTINLPAPDAGDYKIDAASSKLNWLAKKVTGQHNGTVNVKSGSLKIVDGKLTGGEVVLDMKSITVLDQTGEAKGKLEGHLKSEDFFGVDKNAEAKYVISSVTQKGNVQYELNGKLTMKGVTKDQKATITLVPSTGGKMTVSGGMSIDRTEYGVKYGSGKFFKDLGDKMIEDNFTVVFDLKASK